MTTFTPDSPAAVTVPRWRIDELVWEPPHAARDRVRHRQGRPNSRLRRRLRRAGAVAPADTWPKDVGPGDGVTGPFAWETSCGWHPTDPYELPPAVFARLAPGLPGWADTGKRAYRTEREALAALAAALFAVWGVDRVNRRRHRS